MPNFNIGDRVICQGTHRGGRLEELAVVTGFTTAVDGEPLITVRFDKDGKTSSFFPWRFILDDGVSPVCRKIRQMEHRWANFQHKKSQQAAQERVNAMV